MKIVIIDSGIGLLPFIKYAINKKCKADFYVLMDLDLFPLGQKSKKEILCSIEKFKEEIEIIRPDAIIIACNTLSSFIDKQFNGYQIYKILDYNKNENKTILATSATKEKLKNHYTVYGFETLALSIQQINISDVIKEIKRIKEGKYILGCTHYELVKQLFEYYHKSSTFEVNTERLFKSMSFEDGIPKIYCHPNIKPLIQQYFYKMVIYEI